MRIGFVSILLLSFTFQLLFALPARSQKINEVKVKLELNNESVLTALKRIEAQTPFRFVYRKEGIKALSRNVNASTYTVEQALNILLENSGLSYKQIQNNILIIPDNDVIADNVDKIVSIPVSKPDEIIPSPAAIIIRGQVTSSTGETLPGVSIKLKGGTIGTTTDAEGRYTLSVPDNTAVLVFTYIGYEMQEISVGGKTTINAILQISTTSLDEIVVVGYGTVARKDLTGSVGSLSNLEMKDLSTTRAEQALSGRVAGVQVKISDGEPGGSPQIRIRGVGSITAGSGPLYVVDGFPTDNIQMINPNDIETMDILKDASATAIYGSRGSGGVIIINTKRGVIGKTKISFDTYYGVQEVSRTPKFFNAMEQATYYYNSIKNRNIDLGNNVTGDPTIWALRVPQTVLDVVNGTNTTASYALDSVLRVAPQRSYSLAFSGGTDNVKYAVSGEYLNQNGIILHNDFTRYSFRANIDAQLTKRFSVKANINPSYTSNNNIVAEGGGAGASSSIIGSATSAQPYYPLHNPDGSYFVMGLGGVDSSTDLYNPLALALERTNVSSRTSLILNLNSTYDIGQGFKMNIAAGARTNASKTRDFWPNIPAFLNRLASGSDGAGYGYNWILEYTLNYNKVIGNHNIAGLAGYSAQEDISESNSIGSNNGYPNNLIQSLSAVSNVVNSATSSRNENSLVSQLARINYNYAGKYYVTASIRRDGSSRFGGNNKYGVFPSAAISWRVSDEKFMKNVPLISQLKLRGSYGETGNNNIGNYATQATISYVRYTTGGAVVAGYAPNSLENPDLTWETQKQFNVGTDISLLKGRLNLTVDHFISRNTDLLLNVNIPASTGLNTTLVNIGEVKNTGWEFVLGTVNFDSKFKWSTDFNLSAYKNEVVKLGPSGDPIISGNNITMIGQPIGMFWGLTADGIFKNSAELAAGPIWNKGGADDSRVGDIRFKDLNGDGKIDQVNDLGIMGTPYPDFYYGMTNKFSYKNISLSANIAGSYGNQIYSNAAVIYKLIRSRSRTSISELNYWKSEADPGDGRTVRPNDNPRGGVRIASTRYMDSGTYLRVNNITLSYSFPEQIATRLRLGSLRMYLNANNPFIITTNHSFNPDVSNSTSSLTPGQDSNNYPVPKSIILGLNVGF